MRKRRKGEAALLTKQLDDATRELAKLRKPYCEWCVWLDGDDAIFGRLEAHHIVSRGRFALRFNQRNIVMLCWRHHYQDGAHGDIIANGKFREFLQATRPEDLAYVEAHAEDDGKMTIPQKRDLLALIRSQIAEAA